MVMVGGEVAPMYRSPLLWCLQVVVDSPSIEQATSILRGLRPRYRAPPWRHHQRISAAGGG